MPLKKAERKERYAEIINALIRGDYEQVYTKTCVMCGQDTGLFVLTPFDKAQADCKARQQKEQQK